jgi:hypothetical protein
VEDVVCMTQVTMQLHVSEHSNSSKMVSSNDQEGGREGADVEMQQQNMGCSKFPRIAECLHKMSYYLYRMVECLHRMA